MKDIYILEPAWYRCRLGTPVRNVSFSSVDAPNPIRKDPRFVKMLEGARERLKITV